MNLIFQAVALLAFILPGLLFRSAYKQGLWNYPLGRLGSFTEQVPRSLAHAAWINFVWAWAVGRIHHAWPSTIQDINYKAVIYWLTNKFGSNDMYFDTAVKSLTDHPSQVFLYFFFMYAFSIACGWAMYGAVRYLKLDRYVPALRFDNDWHYQLHGEILDFPDYIKRGGTADIKHKDRGWTIVVAVVDLKDQSCLYSGILIDFFFDQHGNIDRLLLVGAMRRSFDKDAAGDDICSESIDPARWYKIKGHYFVLRMSEIKTLNFDYIAAKDKEVEDIAADMNRDLDLELAELEEEEARRREKHVEDLLREMRDQIEDALPLVDGPTVEDRAPSESPDPGAEESSSS